MFGYKKLLSRIDHLEAVVNRLRDDFELQIGDFNRREIDKCETINMNFNRLNTMLNEFKGCIAQSRAQFVEFQKYKKPEEKPNVKRVYKKRKPKPEKDSQ